MSTRVLVTGGGGLIGQYALEPLRSAGAELYTTSRTRNGLDGSGTRWLACDLTNTEELDKAFREARPDGLLHLAWDTSRGYLESESNFAWLTSGLEMLRLFARHGGKRAVLVGTCLEYRPSAAPLREDDPVAPFSSYAKCKAELNRLAASFCGENGISFGWGRIFFVYGKNEHPWRLTPSIIEAVRKNEPLTVKGGSLIRDYLYAKDCAAALVKFLLGRVEGAVNICAGRGVRLEEYCRALAKAAGDGRAVRFVDEPGEQPPNIVGAVDRLRDEVGFTPRYGLSSGFSEILDRAPNQMNGELS